MQRLLRLALGAGLAVALAAPAAPAAHAAACNDRDFPEFCAAVGAVCRRTPSICRLFG
jgi:hypothetical protein